jgi:hypothetical protein
MGRVPARLNVINAALMDICLCGYASIRSTQGGGHISELFLAYCALAKQVPHPARYVLREW